MAPRTRSKKHQEESHKDAPVEAPASDDSMRQQQQLPVRAKDGESSTSTEPASAPAEGNLVVFGDDDGAEAMAPAPMTSAKTAAPEPEEDEEDSDDEAPEAVSTTKIASDIKKSAHAAQKAAHEQAAAQKRKRQQRDTLFKQQAEERKKTEEEAEAEAAGDLAVSADALTKKRRASKVEVPNLLPAEFLTDSSSEDEDEDERLKAAVSASRSKKRKIATVEKSLSREARGPRDEQVGSTVYRVAKKVDERMAPKLSKNTKTTKDLLMKRNRAAVPARRRK